MDAPSASVAVTSITNERDGGSLELLLVTDLTPKEFLFGKMGGVAYVTWEMLVLPPVLCLVLWVARALTLENLVYLIVGLAVMDFFVIMLGIHCGLNYDLSKSAIGVSLAGVGLQWRLSEHGAVLGGAGDAALQAARIRAFDETFLAVGVVIASAIFAAWRIRPRPLPAG